MSQTLAGLGLRSLFRNFAATFGRHLAAGLIQLCTVALIARFYGPEGNGGYAVALLLPSLLMAFLNLGFGPANVFYLGSGQYSVLNVLKTSLKFSIFLSVIGLLIGVFSITYKAERFFPDIEPLMLWLALASFPFSFLQSLIASIFQGLQRFREFNIVLLAQPMITLLIVFVFIVVGIQTISLLIIAHLTSVVLTLIASFWLIKKHLGGKKDDLTEHYFSRAIRYGYKAHLSNILAFLNYKADIYLVNLLVSPAAAGIYVIAVQLSERLWMLSQTVSTVLLPRLSQLSTDEEKRLQITPLISRLVLFVTLIGSIFFAAVAYPLIYLIFGKLYLHAYAPLIILFPGIVAGASSRVLANDLASRGRPELNMYTSFLVLAVNIIGNIILIPLWNLNGAAVATSVAYILNFSLRTAMYRYITKISFFDILIIRKEDIRSLMRAMDPKGWTT